MCKDASVLIIGEILITERGGGAKLLFCNLQIPVPIFIIQFHMSFLLVLLRKRVTTTYASSLQTSESALLSCEGKMESQ